MERHVVRSLSRAACRVVAAGLLAVFSAAAPAQQVEPVARPLRVQLLWHHQTQFAGFYVAQARKHFQNEGLEVELKPGGPGINPIVELQEGRADVAVSWLANAWRLSAPGKEVTNVAQLFSGSSLNVVCRISAGIVTPRDIQGRRIGVWNLGDEIVVREMLRRLAIPESSVEFFEQRDAGRDLIQGDAPCVTAMSYNEYWKILEAGIPSTDLIVVRPETFGVPHIEDGLYVRASSLESAEFQDRLARLLRALRRGWGEARLAPTLAVEKVQRLAPDLSREHQRHMLETVLGVVPDPATFGLFDLDRFQATVQAMMIHSSRPAPPPHIWTHAVWNRLADLENLDKPLTVATRHYVSSLLRSPAFSAVLVLGVLIYALSGALEAINRQFDLWGRLVLAFLSGLGGGTLRDLLIGAERMPFYYLKDPTLPLGILGIVLVSTAITARWPDIHHTAGFRKVKKYADVFGFAVLATTGALIGLSSSLPWYWAPVCAALTCAGGGALRDIVINQEPATFKGVIYEEVAVIGGLLLTAGLMLANRVEHTPVPVFAVALATLLSIIGMRLLVYRLDLRYPAWLGGGGSPAH